MAMYELGGKRPTVGLFHIGDVLEKRSEESALLLRKLTGGLRLTPMHPPEGKPYYRAECDILSVAILDEADPGSNWLQWWGKRDRVRNDPRELRDSAGRVRLETC